MQQANQIEEEQLEAIRSTRQLDDYRHIDGLERTWRSSSSATFRSISPLGSFHSDITVEAAGKWERFELAIQGAANQLQELSQKVTQSALAAIAGYSQQYISRHWQKLLQTLLEIPNSKSGNNPEPALEQATLEQATATALNEVAFQSPEITPDEIEQAFFEWVEPDSWSRVWEYLTADAQVKVLQVLLPYLPGKQLQRLFALVGG